MSTVDNGYWLSVCVCVTLIHHCPIVNRFNVAALKKYNTLFLRSEELIALCLSQMGIDSTNSDYFFSRENANGF